MKKEDLIKLGLDEATATKVAEASGDDGSLWRYDLYLRLGWRYCGICDYL